MKFILILSYFLITFIILKITNSDYTLEKFTQLSKIKKIVDARCNKKLIATSINRINNKVDILQKKLEENNYII